MATSETQGPKITDVGFGVRGLCSPGGLALVSMLIGDQEVTVPAEQARTMGVLLIGAASDSELERALVLMLSRAEMETQQIRDFVEDVHQTRAELHEVEWAAAAAPQPPQQPAPPRIEVVGRGRRVN